jgi:DMSO/TMAO reductase YedYZ molybdopterin-dependent catalytic subunit
MIENDYTERQQEQRRISTEGRLPPGQALTLKFPVLHYGSVPTFDPSTWNFRIWGEVEKEMTWIWDEFNRLPRSQARLDLHCVTGWSKTDTLWEGVSVRTLMDTGLLRLKPTATFVMQHAEHGYSVNLPLEVVLQENFILATHYDGEILSPDHGYPLRGVVGAVPGKNDLLTPYLWKGAKWLRSLEFMSNDKPGFWEQAGYNNSADVWKEERYA